MRGIAILNGDRGEYPKLGTFPVQRGDCAMDSQARLDLPIAKQIDCYSDALAPLREAVRRYLEQPSVVANDGTIQIGHRPWVAEFNYMFSLYPGIESAIFERYARGFRIEIPEMYANVLRELNGAFCFGMYLCGVPRSMLGIPPLLDRSIPQCHDLATAASLWAAEYRVPAGMFHFGGRHYSFRENVGYFIDKNDRILCVKTRGKVVGEWTNFSRFLQDELIASEELEQKRHPQP